MNRDDMIVLTMPIKPQSKTNIGMMLGPTLMDLIGNIFEIEKNIGFNILHSYENKENDLQEYLNYINESGIRYDSIFIDKYSSEKLLEIVESMVYSGFLKIKQKKVLHCDCGRVDMIDSEINNAKLYYFINGKRYCNYCHSECKPYNEYVLVFEINDFSQSKSIAPTYLSKEMCMFLETFKGRDLLVSKNRNTEFMITACGQKFNIDVDFLWLNYFKLFDKKKQIYIASNHQLFAMFLMNYISNLTSDKELTFIASPYLNVDLEHAKRQYESRKLAEYRALLLLYNLKWKNKNCTWSDSVFNYLYGISDTRIHNLYKSLVLSSQEMIEEEVKTNDLITTILYKQANMQNNIMVMKRKFKEGIL